MQELDLATFEPTISHGTVLVDFWAPSRDPCRAYLPIYQTASACYPRVTFATVNVESAPQLASALRITMIPTLMAFSDGILVFVHPGFLLADALDVLASDLQRLDMADVRRKRATFAMSAR